MKTSCSHGFLKGFILILLLALLVSCTPGSNSDSTSTVAVTSSNNGNSAEAVAGGTSVTSRSMGNDSEEPAVSIPVLPEGYISYNLHRYALVIGNGRYEEGALRNPTNDASLMASRLADAGFDVYTYQNLTKSGMDEAVSGFVKVVNKDSSATAVVYYAGHGVEVEGVNYLIPVDNAKIESEEDVKIYSYSLDNILSLLTAQEQIIILDACRNNPFKMSGDRAVGVKGGLGALKEAKKGVTMSYLFAAQSGQTAKDGDGGNSIFTAILAEEIEKGNVPISQLFNNVAARVKAMTNDDQVPLSSTTGSDFVFQSEELSKAVLAKWAEQLKKAEADLKKLEEKGTSNNNDAAALAESQAKVALAQAEKEASERRAAQLKADEEKAKREAEEAAQRSVELQAQIDAMKIAAENAATAARMKSIEDNDLNGLLTQIGDILEKLHNSEISAYRNYELKDIEYNSLYDKLADDIDNEPFSLAEKDSSGNPTSMALKMRELRKEDEMAKLDKELEEYKGSIFKVYENEAEQLNSALSLDVKTITSKEYILSSVLGNLHAQLDQFDGKTGGWNLNIYTSVSCCGTEKRYFNKTIFLSYEALTGLKKIEESDIKDVSDYARYQEYVNNVEMFDALFRSEVPIIQVEIECMATASGDNHIFTITPSKISIRRADTNKEISFDSKKALSNLGKGKIEICHEYTVSYSAASCTEDGCLNLKCKHCGATSKEVLEKAWGHDFSKEYCSKCGQKVLYKVGEKGPAGGWVFYDKGRYSDGWRYLEAAPSDLSSTYVWGDDGKFSTSTGIGTGKKNTEIIASKSTSWTKNAAKACLDYKENGYDDWFLPSKDELNLMYINLKQKKLGGFADSVYWSSSEYSGSSSSAWLQGFYSGPQNDYSRSGNSRVRPVRAF